MTNSLGTKRRVIRIIDDTRPTKQTMKTRKANNRKRDKLAKRSRKINRV